MDEDLQYVAVVSGAILLGLFVYWAAGPLVDLAAAYVVPALFVAAIVGLWAGVAFRRLLVAGRRKEELSRLVGASVWSSYLRLGEIVDGMDGRLRDLVAPDLLAAAREVVERGLPRSIERRNRLRAHLDGGGRDGRIREMARLEEALRAEKDDELRTVLEGNLAVLRETEASYAAIAKALRICELRIANVEGQLGNLVAKLRMLESLEGDESRLDSSLEGIRRDLAELEGALLAGEEDERRLLGER